MNKLLVLGLMLLIGIPAAFAMTGGPVFTLGEKMSGMTVEATQSEMQLNRSDGTESFGSQRIMLTARYGLLSNVDCAAQLGTSNVNFESLPGGYSEYASDWGFAWGGSIRAGFPEQANPFQILAALNYFGFTPTGKTTNGAKNVSTSYQWHEISPTLSAGYAVGAMVPYVGLTKPFLFGSKTVDVSFNGQDFPAAGGRLTYSDGDQSVRGLMGLEWRWPDGYSLCAEASAGGNGAWAISLGVAQVLK